MIEIVSEKNIDEVLPLISQYQKFYNATEISDAKNREFFSQFGEKNPAGCLFVFREKSKIVCFATVYFTFASTIVSKVAVLNDLYTLPGYRGKGIGRQLVEHCRIFSSKRGAKRLQWVTAPDNVPAQKLYDSLNTSRSTWCFYTYST